MINKQILLNYLFRLSYIATIVFHLHLLRTILTTKIIKKKKNRNVTVLEHNQKLKAVKIQDESVITILF